MVVVIRMRKVVLHCISYSHAAWGIENSTVVSLPSFYFPLRDDSLRLPLIHLFFLLDHISDLKKFVLTSLMEEVVSHLDDICCLTLAWFSEFFKFPKQVQQTL